MTQYRVAALEKATILLLCALSWLIRVTLNPLILP
jgi:hypothetical protein